MAEIIMAKIEFGEELRQPVDTELLTKSADAVRASLGVVHVVYSEELGREDTSSAPQQDGISELFTAVHNKLHTANTEGVLFPVRLFRPRRWHGDNGW